MSSKFEHITTHLLQSHGVDISKYDDDFLYNSLRKRITETHCASVEEYGAFLEKNNKEGKSLIDSLRISYSNLFRNPLTMAVLERILLPGMILALKTTHRKEIRIWSAACAAGQEAYSLSILMEELRNGSTGPYAYRIFATDISEARINEARKGQFTADALDNLNQKRIRQWFTRHGETYTVKPELKENIDFSVFDLFSEQLSSPPASIFGDFNLVICANLLFYYKHEFRKIILEKVGSCLAKGGYLVTGETERDILLRFNYHEIFPQSAIFSING
ncbi:MAG: CheR family methyltransferase [Bacteroidota bacterium]